MGGTGSSPADLTQRCIYCGQPLAAHVCEAEYRPCSAQIAATVASGDSDDGETCRACGGPLQDHCEFVAESVGVLGVEIVASVAGVTVLQVASYSRCR